MKGARVPTRASVALAELRIAFTVRSDSSPAGLPTRDRSGEDGLSQGSCIFLPRLKFPAFPGLSWLLSRGRPTKQEAGSGRRTALGQS